MLILVKRGAITDRPWGVTLAELARERATGELVVIADGKRHAIAFAGGAITNAVSPAAADSIARIALTSHLVSSTQVAEITRRIAASPERDEIDVLAEVARLSRPQSDTLRRRAITQRAARTFAIEAGMFAFDDSVAVPKLTGGAIDIRTVIYLGARMHVPETRLRNELRELGTRFALRLDAVDELPRFGFTDAERPIIDAARSGTSVAELEATHRELDPRMIAAVIYTLATAGACTETTGRTRRQPSSAEHSAIPPAALVNTRVSTKDRAKTEPPAKPAAVEIPMAVSRTMTPQPAVSRTMTPQPAVSRTMTPQPAVSRTMTPQPAVSRTMTPPATPGLAVGSSPSLKRASVQIPPIAISRTMTPSPTHRAQTSDPVLARTATGTESPIVLMRTPTKDRTPEWLDARDAFQRGEMAMRRDQVAQAVPEFTRALELQPENADYLAMVAWAKFCAASDKASVAEETRKSLAQAIKASDEAVTPRMCLGRVERMLGRDKEALSSFQQVLAMQPHNTAAASEARVLEARLRR